MRGCLHEPLRYHRLYRWGAIGPWGSGSDALTDAHPRADSNADAYAHSNADTHTISSIRLLGGRLGIIFTDLWSHDMTLQLLDTTAGAGDTGKAGGDKVNGNFAQVVARALRSAPNHVASRGLSGKTVLVALSATNGLFPSQSASAASTGVTYNMRIASPVVFDAVRVLIPNVAATAVTGVKVGLGLSTASQGFQSTLPQAGGSGGQATGGNPNNVTNTPDTSQWAANGNGQVSKFYFGNRSKTEIDLPPAYDANRLIPSYTATDWMPTTPIARSDSGTLPLVDIRVQYPAAGTTPASGAAPSSPGVTLTASGFANWGIDGALEPTRPFNGGLVWKTFADGALGVDTGINFQGSNNPVTFDRSVPIIVQFRSMDEVLTILYLNDSIGEYSTGEYAANYAFRGAQAAAAAAGKTISWCPVTWPSGSILDYGRSAESVIDLIQPSILWAKPIGPNETNGTVSQTTYNRALGDLGFCLALAQRIGARVIIEPHLAVNNAGGYSWGATDSFRISWNAYMASKAAGRGYVFADLDTPFIVGGTVVSGQQQPAAAYTSDGVHVAEAGHAALKANASAACAAALNLL